MSGFLLDTCAISELSKRSPNRGLVEFLDAVDPMLVYLSVITIGELRNGIEQLDDGKKKRALEQWIISDVSQEFAGRILAVSADVADRWGRFLAAMKRTGHAVGAIDTLIAATASHANLTVVTRNVRDFASFDIATLCPWK